MKNYDVIVIGGGPGGSTTATFLAQAGIKTAIFEREEYPRFHIGESLLPATMPIFKANGFYKKLEAGKYIRKYGARFIDYGSDDEIYFGFADGFNPDIPMAFEVERALFDKDILAHAVENGVDLYQPERIVEVKPFEDHVEVVTDKGQYSAKFVLDSTGRDALLGKRFSNRNVNKDLNNVAVFAHYKGTKRYEGHNEGDITVGLLPNRSWTWIIPFKGEVTSVGVVCGSDQIAGKEDMEAYLMSRLEGSPRVREIMKNAKRCSEVRVIGNYSHTTEKFYDKRWMLVGDAAIFLDPIFSTGVHVACSSGQFAAEVVIEALAKNLTLDQESLGENYQAKVLKGTKRFRNLVGLFYDGNFVEQMKKTLVRENVRKGFTSAVAGDAWNDDNFLFQKSVL